MRKKIIAGNWKMNKTPSEAAVLASEIRNKISDAKCDVVVCPTAVCIPGVVSALEGSSISVGAQNVHFKESGAYTGELSSAMLKDAGTLYTIIGHSERRQYFGETDETVNLRTKAYEPIWAIGTGKTATAQQADEVCGIIRNTIKELYGEDTAEKIRIQYGGSMNAGNAEELLSMPNIDGGLIGGASLKPDDFAAIIKAAD